MSPRAAHACAKRERILDAIQQTQTRLAEISDQQVAALLRGDLKTENRCTQEWKACQQQFKSLLAELRLHIEEHHCSGLPVQ